MKRCVKCGTETVEFFCQDCGAPVPADFTSAYEEYDNANFDAPPRRGRRAYDPEIPEVPTFLGAYPLFWRRCDSWDDRSSRTEFWCVYLWNALILNALKLFIFLFAALGATVLSALTIYAYVLFQLALLVPMVRLTVRRLHDANFHGLFAGIFVYLPPFLLGGRGLLITALALVVIGLLPPTDGPNGYGEQPCKRFRSYKPKRKRHSDERASDEP